jgi:Secretion system C-terminal sorting domain
MKSLLRLFLLIALPVLSIKKSNAQCTVSNIVIQNVIVTGSLPVSCSVKFDASFNIQNNNGNKYIFIHTWLQNNYPDYFKCVNGQSTLNGSVRAPEALGLGNTLINIGLSNDSPKPVILSAYPPDASVPLTMVDSVRKEILADGSANIILFGVVAIAPVACGTPVVIAADIWSSQAANAQRVHCVNCGIRYSAGYLNVTGFINCFSLTYAASITNNTGIAINGFYKVFADVNNDGYFTPSNDTLLQDNTLFAVAANGRVGISGPIPGVNINRNAFIVITQTSGAASGASRVILLRSTQCSPLPVTFISFKATRINHTNVMLKWQTAAEINNAGFTIERNTGNNRWEMVSVIPAQMPGGNSASTLMYTFNDKNINTGITQYRIKQEDITGRSLFSEIIAVRGDGQNGKIIVYPNPSDGGRVNILFEDEQGIRDIILTDINGRIVKQWAGFTNNSLQIENQNTGIYILKVLTKATGNQSRAKIFISGK